MSSVSAISATNPTATAESVIPAKTLSQEDFFKLLITQMTSQDPMKPLSNAEFMGQMAQFSSLEQTRSMDATISGMRTEQQMLQANSLIGRDVDLKLDSGIVHGTVAAVQIENGTPKIVVNGAAYDLGTVLTIFSRSDKSVTPTKRMLTPLKANARTRNANINTVRNHIAEHMIGNIVDLLTGSKTILHGTVTGVLTEAGKPKLVVNGHQYDMNQVLTVLPASLNNNSLTSQKYASLT